MLKKWKQEKEKMKKKQMKEKKPMFKVCHSNGLPSVEEVYTNPKNNLSSKKKLAIEPKSKNSRTTSAAKTSVKKVEPKEKGKLSTIYRKTLMICF